MRRGRAAAVVLACAAALVSSAGLGAASTRTGQATAEVMLPSAGGVVESAVAVDPRNPKRVVISAIEFGHQKHADVLQYGYQPQSVIWRSADGGQTFGRIGTLPFRLPPSHSGGNDATLAWDPRGPLYAGYLDNDDSSGGEYDGLWVARSDDAGKTWRGRAVATNHYGSDGCSGPDRPTVVVDGKRGTVWAAYQHLTFSDSSCALPDTFEMRVVRSRDGGHTWSAPLRVTQGHGFDGVPAVLPDGNLAIAYFDVAPDNTSPNATCGSDLVDLHLAIVSSSYRVLSDRIALKHLCSAVLVSQGGPASFWQTAITPTVVYDLHARTLVIGATDSQPSGGVYRIARIGETGAARVTTLTSSTPTAVYVTGQLAAGAGKLALSVLDSAPGGFYTPTLLWSHDGGATWSAPVKLGPLSQGNVRPWASVVDPFGLGHYQGLDIGSDGVAHAAWPDTRPGSTDPEIVRTYTRGVVE